MKALVVPEPAAKTLQQLEWTNRSMPNPRANEVLIRTRAVGLNPVDAKIVANGYFDWTYPHTLGLDVAGEIMGLGDRVKGFNVGDRVAGHANFAEDGAFADYVTYPAAALARIPETVDYETAAGSLCTGMTAYQALFRKAQLNNVETVLIHAGAGGVGSMAIQLANAAGKHVITTISEAKRDFVAALNPDAIIDYQEENVTQRVLELTRGLGADLIINAIGDPEADFERIAYNGQLVCVLATPTDAPADKALSISKLDLGGAHRSGDPRQVADLGRMAGELLALVADGKVDPLITKRYASDEIAEGLRALEAHEIVGKAIAVF